MICIAAFINCYLRYQYIYLLKLKSNIYRFYSLALASLDFLHINWMKNGRWAGRRDQLSPGYGSFHERCTTYDLSKNFKILTKIKWLFWWHHHISRLSLALCMVMNNSYPPDTITYVWNYDNCSYWKSAIREVNVSFSKLPVLKYE